MKYQVAILNTEYMDTWVKSALEPFEKQCEFTTFYYKESAELPEIFRSIEGEFDGFIVNGLVSMAILNIACPRKQKPVEAIHMDIPSYYKEILKLAVSPVGFDLDRVYVDFLQGEGLKARLQDGTLDTLAKQFCARIEQMSLEELQGLRHKLEERAERAWRDGNANLVITRFSTIMDAFQKKGIPCYFIFPGREYIREVAGRLMMRLDMDRMRGCFPAVIHISQGKKKKYRDEIFDLSLRRGLLEFNMEYHCDYLIQKRDGFFEVFTSAGVVDAITGRQSCCPLKDYLESAVEGSVCIGYGVGRTMEQARRGALDANREAAGNPAEASFLVNEEERLIGPLSSGECMELDIRSPEKFMEMSEQTGLSPLTLQKICEIAGREEGRIVTARLLAEKMGLTARATNKYLQKMIKGNQACPAGTRQGKSKGRPELLVKIGNTETGRTENGSTEIGKAENRKTEIGKTETGKSEETL